MQATNNYLPGLSTQRAPDQGQQLWICGCSFANGCELAIPNDRYGQVVADFFNVPVNFLTQGGSSIEWATDQIIRSDIRENDIVVWGITGVNRSLHYDKNGVAQHISLRKFDPRHRFFSTIRDQFVAKDAWSQLLSDPIRTNHAIRFIEQVVCVCAKIPAHLILCCHSELSMPDQSNLLCQYLDQTGSYLDLYKNLPQSHLYPDHATDHKHPGPITHKLWAQIIIDHIKHKKFIRTA